MIKVLLAACFVLAIYIIIGRMDEHGKRNDYPG